MVEFGKGGRSIVSLVPICLKITRPSLNLTYSLGSSEVWEYSQMLPSSCCVADLISSQQKKSRMGQRSNKCFGLIAVSLLADLAVMTKCSHLLIAFVGHRSV